MELAGEIAVLPTGLVEVWCGDTRQVCRKAQLEMMGPDLAPSPIPTLLLDLLLACSLGWQL